MAERDLADVERGVVRAGPTGDPRRRRLAGALLRARWAGRPTRSSGRGALRGRRRGTRYIDMVQSYGAVLLGHAHPVVTAAVTAAAATGHDLRRADAGRGAAGRGHLRPGARLRAGPAGLVGHRGGHERGAPGPRRHRSRPGGQVRRLLPRALRRAAGRRGQRRGHARPARLRRRVGGRRGRHRGRPLQRRARARRARGLRDRRAGGGEHGPGRAGAGLPRGAAGRLRRRRGPAGLRRGDHRVPGRARRGDRLGPG